ncbi:MAG TPA: hypothetical protein VHQ67_06095 [Nitrospiraceae bacterium]|nr:hypothetical protein [Nitrospiraceae bacterium]
MKPLLLLFMLVLLGFPAWADEPTSPSPSSSDDLRVEDLPKPITELLEKLQHLSRKIEPEITKMGSRLGHELDETVKKLREELQAQKRKPSE